MLSDHVRKPRSVNWRVHVFPSSLLSLLIAKDFSKLSLCCPAADTCLFVETPESSLYWPSDQKSKSLYIYQSHFSNRESAGILSLFIYIK